MNSVGEIMSIGKSFEEIIQKGLRMVGQGMHGFVCNSDITFENLDDELANPTHMRMFAIAAAFEKGYSVQKLHELTKIDPWFLSKLENIYQYALRAEKMRYDRRNSRRRDARAAKRLGFSDFQIARLVEAPNGNLEKEMIAVRSHRKRLGVLPSVKRINTVASEHPELDQLPLFDLRRFRTRYLLLPQ